MAEKETWANTATITVTESAANTLTFKKLETGINLGTRIAWILHRIEYMHQQVNATVFNATGDQLLLGLTNSNTWTLPSLSNATIIDLVSLSRLDFGAAATEFTEVRPLIRDFTMMPGGGLLMVPNPLYGFAYGSGLTAASSSDIRFFYTQFEMKDADFYELWQTRVQLSA